MSIVFPRILKHGRVTKCEFEIVLLAICQDVNTRVLPRQGFGHIIWDALPQSLFQGGGG